MFNISEFEIGERPIETVPIYPMVNEDDYLHNYEDSDIGSCLSTLGVEAIISDGIFRMGDSAKTFIVTDTNMRGQEGMVVMKEFAKDFVAMAKTVLDEMSEDYRAFYQHMIDDFEKNGIDMPFYGQL